MIISGDPQYVKVCQQVVVEIINGGSVAQFNDLARQQIMGGGMMMMGGGGGQSQQQQHLYQQQQYAMQQAMVRSNNSIINNNNNNSNSNSSNSSRFLCVKLEIGKSWTTVLGGYTTILSCEDVDVGQTRRILNDEGSRRKTKREKKGTLICCR